MTSGSSRGGPRRPSPRGQGPGTRGGGKENGASPPAQSLPQLRKPSRRERPRLYSERTSGSSRAEGPAQSRDSAFRTGSPSCWAPPGALEPPPPRRSGRESPPATPLRLPAQQKAQPRDLYARIRMTVYRLETQETGCPGLWLQACPCSRGPWPTRGARRPCPPCPAVSESATSWRAGSAVLAGSPDSGVRERFPAAPRSSDVGARRRGCRGAGWGPVPLPAQASGAEAHSG